MSTKFCTKKPCQLVLVLQCLRVVALTAQSVSQCVCRGEASRQLEWVLLEAHFALLQRLIQQGGSQNRPGEQMRSLVAKRSQALVALIRLTSIAPCQELLDMQEKVGRSRNGYRNVQFIKNLCLRTNLDKDGIVLTGCLLCCCVQACQLAVMTNPRDSHALCLLGLAQLAQYDSNPDSDGSKEAMSDASLSFQASIETENKTQSGEPPEQLTSEFVNSTS